MPIRPTNVAVESRVIACRISLIPYQRSPDGLRENAIQVEVDLVNDADILAAEPYRRNDRLDAELNLLADQMIPGLIVLIVCSPLSRFRSKVDVDAMAT